MRRQPTNTPADQRKKHVNTLMPQPNTPDSPNKRHHQRTHRPGSPHPPPRPCRHHRPSQLLQGTNLRVPLDIGRSNSSSKNRQSSPHRAPTHLQNRRNRRRATLPKNPQEPPTRRNPQPTSVPSIPTCFILTCGYLPPCFADTRGSGFFPPNGCA